MLTAGVKAARLGERWPVMGWCFRHYCQKTKEEAGETKEVKVFVEEEKKEKSVLQSLLGDLSVSPSTLAYLNRKDAFTVEGYLLRAQETMNAKNVKSQEFNKKRHKILGPNLATAHFLVSRGAAVRFVDSSSWIRKEEMNKLPMKFVPNLYLEEIDASNTQLLYEGFDNLVHLYQLKRLILRNCEHVDDWCLDRLHIFSESPLEHLDISSCTRITERGLCSLHKLRRLKTLCVEDLPNVKHKELMYMMIEDCIPGIQIIDSKRQEMSI